MGKALAQGNRSGPATIQPSPLAPSLAPLVDPEAAQKVYGNLPGAYGRLTATWWAMSTCPAEAKPLLRRAIDDHAAALAPAPPEFIGAHLARLTMHYRVGRSEVEWQIVGEDMIEDLSEIPADILLAAIKQHRRTSSFYPKSSELLAIAGPLLSERQFRLQRMQHLLALPTPEEVARQATEAHAAEIARKHAAHDEDLRKSPEMRLFWKYRGALESARVLDLMQWFRDVARNHDLARIEGWCTIVADELVNATSPFDSLRRLRELALEHVMRHARDRLDVDSEVHP